MFNKVLNPKIVSIIIACVFILNNTAYGIDLSNDHLRVPLGNYDRINKSIKRQNRPEAQGVDSSLRVYSGTRDMVENLPGEIGRNIGTDSMPIIKWLEGVYGLHKGLLYDFYHNHGHNLGTANIFSYFLKNFSITGRDMSLAILAALMHDFQSRIPEGDKGIPAYVPETLLQLRDLMGIEDYPGPAQEKIPASYKEKISEELKNEFRKILSKLFPGESIEDVYKEIEAMIRRTDFASDVALPKAEYRNAAAEIRKQMDQCLDQLNEAGSLDRAMEIITVGYSKILEREGISESDKTWLVRQKGIESGYVSSLGNVNPERRSLIHTMSLLLETADQTSFHVLLVKEAVENEIISGLKKEGVNASPKGNYKYFYKPQFLGKQEVLAALKTLPVEYRRNFVNTMEYFAGLDDALKDWDTIKGDVYSKLGLESIGSPTEDKSAFLLTEAKPVAQPTSLITVKVSAEMKLAQVEEFTLGGRLMKRYRPFDLPLESQLNAEGQKILQAIRDIEIELGRKAIVLYSGSVRDILLGRGGTMRDFDFVVLVDPDNLVTGSIRKEVIFILNLLEQKLGMKKDSILARDGILDYLAFYNTKTGEIIPKIDLKQFIGNIQESINALMLYSDGILIDPVGGVVDLQNGAIRFIGRDPEEFVNHQTILRAVRFKFQLGFDYDIDTKRIVEEFFSDTSQASSYKERRIWNEWLKKAEWYHSYSAAKIKGDYVKAIALADEYIARDDKSFPRDPKSLDPFEGFEISEIERLSLMREKRERGDLKGALEYFERFLTLWEKGQLFINSVNVRVDLRQDKAANLYEDPFAVGVMVRDIIKFAQDPDAAAAELQRIGFGRFLEASGIDIKAVLQQRRTMGTVSSPDELYRMEAARQSL